MVYEVRQAKHIKFRMIEDQYIYIYKYVSFYSITFERKLWEAFTKVLENTRKMLIETCFEHNLDGERNFKHIMLTIRDLEKIMLKMMYLS